MSVMVSELYDALRSVGVADDIARAAAQSVIAIEDKAMLATKADMTALIAELKSDLTWRIVLAMGVQTAVFSAIATALRLVRP